ncbi:MAG: LysM peptidoglycan-binding domain-containing protein [Chloroflexota bacterium]|nr:LysM peptidoglycan-binding domain-containing protein [Chloroflexota bacterium]
MKKMLRVPIILFVLLVATTSLMPPVAAASPAFVVVNWGDTLYSVAMRNGTSVDALIRANGLPNPNFIYAGQRLVVPTGSAGWGAPAPIPLVASVYTVNYGDTLATIAGRYGTTVAAMLRANNLYNPNFIYAGQRLNLPGRSASLAPQSPSAPANPPAPGNAAPAPTNGKWIDIDISTQTITAYQGSTPLKSVLVSTGVSWHPTPIGHFKIYVKIPSQTMSGGVGAEAYYLPGVPWVMYFAGANAIHGTYWHHNFGHPMSHGCVNLTIDDAHWFYDWADVGTPVIVRL